MSKSLYFVLSVMASLLVLGCVGTDNNKVVVAPKVVNPFDGGEIAPADIPQSIALLPVHHQPGHKNAGPIVRQMMQNHFGALGYQLMPLQQIDDNLEKGNIDLANFSPSPDLLAKMLGVDAVMVGRITDVQSDAISMDMQLYNNAGKKLWHLKNSQTAQANVTVSDDMALLVNIGLIGLKFEARNLLQAAEQLGHYAAKKMPTTAAVKTAQHPNIDFVVFDAAQRLLKAGDSVNIALKGNPGGQATVEIAGVGKADLVERTPGEYFGSLTVKGSLNVADAPVKGILVDKNGERSQWHSVYGTITVDTQPPGPVSELLLMGNDASGVVSWKASNSVDTAGYQVTLQGEGEKTIIKKTTNTRLKLTSLTNFIDYHVSVVALDEAQNQSPAVSSRFKPVPDVSMAHAVALTEFPKRLRQASVLTKENSPYKLDHALSISESAVLFIEPGVKIQTTANASITVKGEIAAFGTRKRPIVINTTGTKLYNPFIVLDSDMPSTLQGMKISGMGVTIDVKQGDHLIEDCQLLSSSLSAIIIGGSATPILKNNVIADSNASGVVISAEAKPRFVGNRFSNNRPFQIQSSSIHQVDARNSQWQPQASTITVLGNVLY